jgi:hypothetical protein
VKQTDYRDVFRRPPTVCVSNTVVSPDPLSSSPSAMRTHKTQEMTLNRQTKEI